MNASAAPLDEPTIRDDIPLAEQFPELFKGMSGKQYGMIISILEDDADFGNEPTYEYLKEIVDIFNKNSI